MPKRTKLTCEELQKMGAELALDASSHQAVKLGLSGTDRYQRLSLHNVRDAVAPEAYHHAVRALPRLRVVRGVRNRTRPQDLLPRLPRVPVDEPFLPREVSRMTLQLCPAPPIRGSSISDDHPGLHCSVLQGDKWMLLATWPVVRMLKFLWQRCIYAHSLMSNRCIL